MAVVAAQRVLAGCGGLVSGPGVGLEVRAWVS